MLLSIVDFDTRQEAFSDTVTPVLVLLEITEYLIRAVPPRNILTPLLQLDIVSLTSLLPTLVRSPRTIPEPTDNPPPQLVIDTSVRVACPPKTSASPLLAKL